MMLPPATVPGQAAQRVSLESLRDTARPLVMFAASPDDPRLREQWIILAANASEARDRDLAPVEVPGSPDRTHPVRSYALLDEAAARTRFHVAAHTFTVILIGKDGGEKLRSTEPIAFETLRRTIDAMPMRQDEMRRQR